MKRIFFIFFIFLFSNSLFSQIQDVDSLLHVLKTKKLTHKEQAELYDKIAISYGSQNAYEKAIEYAEKGLTVVRKENDIAASLNGSIGVAYYSMGENEKALPYLDKALDLAIKANDKEEEGATLMSIGAYYGRQGKYVEAQEYFIKALSIYESIGNKEKCAQLYGNIGMIHIALESLDRGVFYFERSATLLGELNKQHLMMSPFYELGRAYLRKRDIDNALKFTLKSVELSRTYNSLIFEALGLVGLANIYNTSGEYDKAMQYSKESIPVSEKTNDPIIMSNTWKLISDIYRNKQQYKESEETAYKAWKLDSMNFATKPDLLFNIANANLFLGNREKASAFFIKYTNEIKEQADKNFQETLIDMEVKYETEKKEMRITTLEKEKQLYIWLLIAGCFALLMFLGVLFFRYRLNAQKRKIAEQEREIARGKVEQLEQEKQLVATQAILDGETAERSRLARDLHDGLGGMLSVVKLNLEKELNPAAINEQNPDQQNKAMKMLNESIVELRRIAHHMMPESLMHSGLKVSLEDFCRAIPNAHFQFIGEDSRLDSHLEVVLYRCAYELINNAVKYANASNINVQLLIEKGIIALTVDDDGIGFDPDKVIPGTGLENIRARILAYNGKITIRSASQEGTEIIIEIELA